MELSNYEKVIGTYNARSKNNYSKMLVVFKFSILDQKSY